LKQDNAQYSTCTCNHLTNFAILMSPSDVELVSAIVYNVCDGHGRPNSAPQSAIYI